MNNLFIKNKMIGGITLYTSIILYNARIAQFAPFEVLGLINSEKNSFKFHTYLI